MNAHQAVAGFLELLEIVALGQAVDSRSLQSCDFSLGGTAASQCWGVGKRVSSDRRREVLSNVGHIALGGRSSALWRVCLFSPSTIECRESGASACVGFACVSLFDRRTGTVDNAIPQVGHLPSMGASPGAKPKSSWLVRARLPIDSTMEAAVC